MPSYNECLMAFVYLFGIYLDTVLDAFVRFETHPCGKVIIVYHSTCWWRIAYSSGSPPVVPVTVVESQPSLSVIIFRGPSTKVDLDLCSVSGNARNKACLCGNKFTWGPEVIPTSQMRLCDFTYIQSGRVSVFIPRCLTAATCCIVHVQCLAKVNQPPPAFSMFCCLTTWN